MKVAIFSESENDELALRILIEAVLELKTQTIPFPPQARGWPAIRDGLPAVLRFLHYRTDADALVVVTDADDSPLHQLNHEQFGQTVRDCRYCSLGETARPIQQQLKSLPGRATLKLAIGVAVPAIEAWYLCGLDSRASEASWLQGGTTTRGSDIRRELKRRIYKQPQPLTKSDLVREQAHRLAQNLPLLESHFPSGFGPLVRALKSW